MKMIDYELISRENEKKYGTDIESYAWVFADQYSDSTHFVYELLQNAEDASATTISFHLFLDRLEIKHNGKDFDFDDVQAICGIGRGTKGNDSNKIGKFGIGFKSVFAFTKTPKIYSGEEAFCIERYVHPHRLEDSNLVNNGKNETLFVLPFDREDVAPEKAFRKIGDRLKNLGPRTLLFLKNLKEIHWKIEGEDEGLYLCQTLPIKQIENVYEISLIWEVGSNCDEEKWLKFSHPFYYSKENSKEKKLFQAEIAFRLEEKDKPGIRKIMPTDGAGLVVFFPTEKETYLRFLIQGPYNTTPARDNVLKNDEWNKILVEKTAELLEEAIFKIREMGLLTADFLDILPLEEDFSGERDKIFYPLAKKLRGVLQNELLLPTAEGSYVAAKKKHFWQEPMLCVFYSIPVI